jgi:hypothetical protein
MKTFIDYSSFVFTLNTIRIRIKIPMRYKQRAMMPSNRAVPDIERGMNAERNALEVPCMASEIRLAAPFTSIGNNPIETRMSNIRINHGCIYLVPSRKSDFRIPKGVHWAAPYFKICFRSLIRPQKKMIHAIVSAVS